MYTKLEKEELDEYVRGVEKFMSEIAEKVKATGMSTMEVLMFGFATGRTPNSYQKMFETLLARKLTVDEHGILEGLEGEMYCRVESIIGPLETEAA